MPNISSSELIAQFQTALREGWGYIYGASGEIWTQAQQNAASREQTKKYGQKWVGHRVADCSGLFAWAFRQLGGYCYHGSNTIFRKYLARSGTIASAAGLRPGMAVFKWKPVTPARFSDGLGDFCHIGLVTSVSPLRIVHASTEGMAVKADSKIGKWRYWGWLKDVAETSSFNSAGDSAVSTSSSVSRPTLRTGSRGDSVRLLQTLLNRAGYDLAVDGIFGTMTRCSVKGFQSERGLAVDGIVGKQTWAALEGGGA
jgi:hypothetical protein